MSAAERAEVVAERSKQVADYIAAQVNLCGKKQLEIAEIAGFEKANMITMIKQNKSKVPLEKIGRLATALEVDQVFFFKMVISAYHPELWPIIEGMFKQPVLTKNELEMIRVIRQSNVVNPKLHTDEERFALLDVVNRLKPDNTANES